MSERLGFVINEHGDLVPFMFSVFENDGSEYIAEKEFLFLTDRSIPCPEAEQFTRGVSIGASYQIMKQALAEVEKDDGDLSN